MVLTHIRKRRADIGNVSFDKEERRAPMFAAAAANLRAYADSVPLQSPSTVNGIACDIVQYLQWRHCSTTGAISGGRILLEKIVLIPEPLKAGKRAVLSALKASSFRLFLGQLTLELFVAGVLKGKLTTLQSGVHVKTGDCYNNLEDDDIDTYTENLTRTPKHYLLKTEANWLWRILLRIFKLLCTSDMWRGSRR